MATTFALQNQTDQDYAKYEMLIHKVVNSFYDQHGWRMYLDKPRKEGYAELFEEAQLHYMRAYRSWDESKGSLKNRIASCIYYGLFDSYRQKVSRYVNSHQEAADLEEIKEEVNPFDLERLLGDVSTDAAILIELFLEAPKTNHQNKKSAVVSFLQELGWCGKRILEAFGEVKDALLS